MRCHIRMLAFGAVLALAPIVGGAAQGAVPEPGTPETELPTPGAIPVLELPGWIEADDDSFVRTQSLAATQDSQLVRLDLDLLQSGYVALVAGENNLPVSGVTIFDGSGLSYQSASARITSPEGAYVVIDRPAGSAAIDLTIRSWPEMDLTEPNDDGLLAWPLEIGAATETTLMPAGDQDVFRFTLDEEAHLTLVSESDQGLQIQIVDPDTESVVANGQDVSLLAGDHLLRLSFANGNQLNPEPIQFALVERQIATIAEQGSAPTELSVGVPTYAPLTADGLAKMALEVKQDGFFKFRASNVGPNASFVIVDENGSSWRGSEVHLSKGNYALTLSGIRQTRYPIMVSTFEGNMQDPYEPNDFYTDATELALDEPVELIMERDLAADWVTFTPTREGKAFILAEALENRQGGCQDLQTNIITQLNPFEIEILTLRGPNAARTFGPIEVVAGEPVQAQIFCATQNNTETTTYRVRIDMPDMNQTKSDASVYLVGLELDDSLRGAMQMSSDISGVQFLEAEEAEALDERIEEIARAETRAGPPLWLILLIVATLGAGAAFWFLRRGQKKPGSV